MEAKGTGLINVPTWDDPTFRLFPLQTTNMMAHWARNSCLLNSQDSGTLNSSIQKPKSHKQANPI